MATFYVDPVLGNDANNGTTWALARKTLTSAGWGSIPGLAESDTVLVAKSPDPVAVGSLTFTQGSKVVDFNDLAVTTILDSKTAPTVIRNTYLTTPVAADLQLTGTTGAGTNALALTARSNGGFTNAYYSLLGALTFPQITLPSVGKGKHYIAMRVSGRAATTKLAITCYTTAPSTQGNYYSNTNGLSGDYFDVSRSVTLLNGADGNPASGSVNVGGALYSTTESEQMGGTDTVFFPVPSIGTLQAIGILAYGSNTAITVDGIFLVSDLGATLPNPLPVSAAQGGRTVGLNMVIGATTGSYTQMQQLSSFYVRDVAPGVSPAKLSAMMTFNWNTPTATAPGRVALTTQLNYDVFISAGGAASGYLTIKGGVNRATSLQDGITRVSDAFSTAKAVTPSTHLFELFLRNGMFRGFSTFNFAQGVRLRLNSTRSNQVYSFEDISSNNYGYYVYSDDATCPSNIFFKHSYFGPNNGLLLDATITACPGWQDNANVKWTSANASSATASLSRRRGLSYSSTTAATSTLTHFDRIRFVGWPVAGASTSSQMIRAKRAVKYTPIPMSTTVGETAARTFTGRWSPVSAGSLVAGRVAAFRSAAFQSSTAPSTSTAIRRAMRDPWSTTASSSVTGSADALRRASLEEVSAAAAVSETAGRSLSPGFDASAESGFAGDFTRERVVDFSVPVHQYTGMTVRTIRGFVSDNFSLATVELLRALPVEWSSASALSASFNANPMFRWNVGAQSDAGVDWTRGRELNWDGLGAASAHSWSAGGLRDVSLRVDEEGRVGFSARAKRRVSYRAQSTPRVTETADRSASARFSARALPAAGFRALRSFPASFAASAATSSSTAIEYNKTVFYRADGASHFDASLLKRSMVAAGFGSTSGSDFALGVGRTVGSTTRASAMAGVTVSRGVSLGWGSATRLHFAYGARPNRFDEFLVEYEAPSTRSLRDGSIVLGARTVESSGELHDVRPSYGVTVEPPPYYTVTISEGSS